MYNKREKRCLHYKILVRRNDRSYRDLYYRFTNGFFVYRYSDLPRSWPVRSCSENCPTNIKFVVLILDSFNFVIL